ncbi:hypothetical protein HXX76_001862 [Chlamydomonas incerta]|uniref:Ionotropic glutamate receptor C-terminal domain-containing protein n=1 Tax=Chlamydomonas incerta TaxID=51695 RepID=A0A835TMN8_CHLIN|nr:hypothetical protein HXX76_001862 [Chlamydomonas incerta]|eukprot:KAG2443509.1 hypothetical protein HXX76_001862 [Chlamydomonas incerta]
MAVTGLLVELMRKILENSPGLAGVTWEFYLEATGTGGFLQPNGKWNGIMAELVEQRADIALFPMTRTLTRYLSVDCTLTYMDSGISVVVINGMETTGALSVLAPFTWTLWIVILCTVICIALVFWALDVYGQWVRSTRIAKLQKSGTLPMERHGGGGGGGGGGPARVGKSKSGKAAEKEKDSRSTVLISFIAAAGAPERPERSGWGVQVLYVVYCFFCFILLSAYTANLTSFLSVQRAAVAIGSLEDIARDRGILAVNPNGSTAAYFYRSSDPVAMQLYPNLVYCETSKCLEMLRAGEVQGFATDKPLLDYMAGQQPCDLALIGDPFGPSGMIFALQRNSPLTQYFNLGIQRFIEDGTLTSMQRSWWDGLAQCGNTDGVDLNNSQLGLPQMMGAFVLLSIGILVAFVIGTVENLKWCIMRNYKQQQAVELHEQQQRDLQRLRSGGPGSGGEGPEPAPEAGSGHGGRRFLGLGQGLWNRVTGNSRPTRNNGSGRVGAGAGAVGHVSGSFGAAAAAAGGGSVVATPGSANSASALLGGRRGQQQRQPTSTELTPTASAAPALLAGAGAGAEGALTTYRTPPPAYRGGGGGGSGAYGNGSGSGSGSESEAEGTSDEDYADGPWNDPAARHRTGRDPLQPQPALPAVAANGVHHGGHHGLPSSSAAAAAHAAGDVEQGAVFASPTRASAPLPPLPTGTAAAGAHRPSSASHGAAPPPRQPSWLHRSGSNRVYPGSHTAAAAAAAAAAADGGGAAAPDGARRRSASRRVSENGWTSGGGGGGGEGEGEGPAASAALPPPHRAAEPHHAPPQPQPPQPHHAPPQLQTQGAPAPSAVAPGVISSPGSSSPYERLAGGPPPPTPTAGALRSSVSGALSGRLPPLAARLPAMPVRPSNSGGGGGSGGGGSGGGE